MRKKKKLLVLVSIITFSIVLFSSVPIYASTDYSNEIAKIEADVDKAITGATKSKSIEEIAKIESKIDEVIKSSMGSNEKETGLSTKGWVVCPLCKASVGYSEYKSATSDGEVKCIKGFKDENTGKLLHDPLYTFYDVFEWKCYNTNCGWKNITKNTLYRQPICVHDI